MWCCLGRSLMMFAFLIKIVVRERDTYMDMTLLKDFQNFLMKTEMIHLNQGREMYQKGQNKTPFEPRVAILIKQFDGYEGEKG